MYNFSPTFHWGFTLEYFFMRLLIGLILFIFLFSFNRQYFLNSHNHHCIFIVFIILHYVRAVWIMPVFDTLPVKYSYTLISDFIYYNCLFIYFCFYSCWNFYFTKNMFWFVFITGSKNIKQNYWNIMNVFMSIHFF